MNLLVYYEIEMPRVRRETVGAASSPHCNRWKKMRHNGGIHPE